MSSSSSSSSSSGMGFCGALTILFIALKLCGVIFWDWFWVLAPLWIPFLILITILIVLLIIDAILSKDGRRKL